VSKVIGPVLATGAITLANQSILGNKPVDWRIPVATGFVAITLSLLERPLPKLAQMMAWTMLVGVTFTEINDDQPAPVERLVTWWQDNGPHYTPPKNG
jgi:hypothetical protein